MQTHQDIWFSVGREMEHVYFRTGPQPFPVLDFIPWPIKVTAVVFPDGSSMSSAGPGGVQTPWFQNVDANGFTLDNLGQLRVNNRTAFGYGFGVEIGYDRNTGY